MTTANKIQLGSILALLIILSVGSVYLRLHLSRLPSVQEDNTHVVNLFQKRQKLIVKFSMERHKNILNELKTIKNLEYYSDDKNPIRLGVTVKMPTRLIDNYTSISMLMKSYDCEAEQMTADKASTGANSAEAFQQLTSKAHIAFLYKDLSEKYVKKNYTAVNEAYTSLLKSYSAGQNQQSLDPAVLTRQTQNLLVAAYNNPVLLYRKKIVFFLVYDEGRYIVKNSPYKLLEEEIGKNIVPPESRNRQQDPNPEPLKNAKGERYYVPPLNSNQFWLRESDFLLYSNINRAESFQLLIDLYVISARVHAWLEWFATILDEDFSFYFDNLTTDMVKNMILQQDWVEAFISFVCIFGHLVLKVKIIREEAKYFHNYSSSDGLDWRHLSIQVFSPFLIFLLTFSKSYPGAIQMAYLLNALTCLINRNKVNTFRINRKLFGCSLSLEMRQDHHKMPKSKAFMIMTITTLLSMTIIILVLLSDFLRRATIGTAPVFLTDVVYMLQFINSIGSLSVIVAAYRTNLMDNLPWKLLIAKGGLKIGELVFFDINELPSFKIINFVRDDFVLVAAIIFKGFSAERRNYGRKLEFIRLRQRMLEREKKEAEEGANQSLDTGEQQERSQEVQQEPGLFDFSTPCQPEIFVPRNSGQDSLSKKER